VGAALAILAVAIREIVTTSTSSQTFELVIGAALLAYFMLRRTDLLPRHALWPAAAVALAVVLGFTTAGSVLLGTYDGGDVSNRGRSEEARVVREAVSSSPSSLVVGKGLGATVDLSNAPPVYAKTLELAGRDVAAVDDVHLLHYELLLKRGLFGIVWLAAFVVLLIRLVAIAADRVFGWREPDLVFFTLMPVLGTVSSFAAASHLFANPLIALALGILVTALAGSPATDTAPRPAASRL
jgi:hypothetical protein